ncbi:hypothetical protein SD72_15055 [Leucobacter komagatae]|uniref:Periplasmic binding protein domain-containing protein n=1 Tax=Leucobacter komagatae TaxID=55969 RepID=A0A0D0H326_9MICO|nr:hypothetical protein SD72_15055 [Leucobacter komagatae]
MVGAVSLLLGASLVALTGCASGSDGGGGSQSSGGTGVFANKGMDYFFFAMQSEAIQRKSEELGYKFSTTDAKHDSSQQFNDAKSLLVQKPAFLIVDPVDSAAWGPVIEQANRDKIPFGIVDTPITTGRADFQVAFDNRLAGEMAAEEIVKGLKAKYGEPKGKVLNGYGALSSSAWKARKEGFDEVLAQYPDVQVIERPTEGAETTARQVTDATLSEHPDLDAAHAPSDSITRGIITAIKSKGKLKPRGEDGHIIITTIDGEPQALNWYREGIIDASVSQDPVAYGQIAVEMLTEYVAKGKDIPLGEYVDEKYYWETAVIEDTANGPTMTIPPYVIAEDNVEDSRQWANLVTTEWGQKQ